MDKAIQANIERAKQVKWDGSLPGRMYRNLSKRNFHADEQTCINMARIMKVTK